MSLNNDVFFLLYSHLWMHKCWHNVSGSCTVSSTDRGSSYSSRGPCSWGNKALGTTSLPHLDCQFKWGTPVFLRVLHSNSPTHQTMVQIQEPHLLLPAHFLNWQQILMQPWPPATAWWTEAWQETWEDSLALESILRCSRMSSSFQDQVWRAQLYVPFLSKTPLSVLRWVQVLLHMCFHSLTLRHCAAEERWWQEVQILAT